MSDDWTARIGDEREFVSPAEAKDFMQSEFFKFTDKLLTQIYQFLEQHKLATANAINSLYSRGSTIDNSVLLDRPYVVALEKLFEGVKKFEDTLGEVEAVHSMASVSADDKVYIHNLSNPEVVEYVGGKLQERIDWIEFVIPEMKKNLRLGFEPKDIKVEHLDKARIAAAIEKFVGIVDNTKIALQVVKALGKEEIGATEILERIKGLRKNLNTPEKVQSAILG